MKKESIVHIWSKAQFWDFTIQDFLCPYIPETYYEIERLWTINIKMSQAIFIQIRTVWRMMKTYLAQRCKSSTGFSLVQVMPHLAKYFSSSNPNHTIIDYLDFWVTFSCLWKFETSTSSSYESKNSWLHIQSIVQNAIRYISSLNVSQQTK